MIQSSRANPIVVLLIGVGGAACARVDAPPDRIVYSSFRPANWDIYLFRGPDADPTAVVDHPSLDYDAVFSPDGRWLVFTSERNGSPDLLALDLSAADAEPQLLIESQAMEDQAAFSPAGDRLAFVGTQSGNAEIYVIAFDPLRLQSMADAENVTNHPGGDFRPAFSPDGSRLAFSTDRDTPPVGHPPFPFARQREGEIYTLRLGDGEARRITDLPGWEGSPVWSADGARLFFYSQGGALPETLRRGPAVEGGFGIWSAAADGSDRVRITHEGVEALSPRLTTGGRLVFATREGAGRDVEWDVVSIGLGEDGAAVRSEIGEALDCWGPGVHPDRGLVCHGPGDSAVPDSPVAGFEEAPLLFPGYPVRRQVAGIEVDLHSMNHGFSVPPHPFLDQVLVGGGGEASELFVSRIDGGDARRIASADLGAILAMRWSKEGDWVTYTVGPFLGRAAARSDVWRARPDGSQAQNLTRDSTANDGMGDFLAGGDRLVLRSGRADAFELYVMSADGSGVERLTEDAHKDNFPATSPTRNQIVFVSDRDGTADAAGQKDFDLYLMDLDGDRKGEIRRITSSPGQDSHAQFSPDGEWIIYTSEKGGINDEEPLLQELMFNPQMYGEIFAYRIRDGSSVRLTHDKWEDGGPFWVGPVTTTEGEIDARSGTGAGSR